MARQEPPYRSRRAKLQLASAMTMPSQTMTQTMYQIANGASAKNGVPPPSRPAHPAGIAYTFDRAVVERVADRQRDPADPPNEEQHQGDYAARHRRQAGAE